MADVAFPVLAAVAWAAVGAALIRIRKLTNELKARTNSDVATSPSGAPADGSSSSVSALGVTGAGVFAIEEIRPFLL